MERSTIVNTFTALVDQLRNTECGQKEKIACFQAIAECIISPALAANINYATHCSTAVNVLLLFCEDLDAVVRMSAEENLNKIFRVLEKTRVSRILMDLYGEIKRNGNQRSLRICLNLFAYYAPQIKEKHIYWYAIRLVSCLQVMAQRKETQLNETLCDFVKCFGRFLQVGLTDSEMCKLLDVYLINIASDCPVKRRCSAQNCITLIENARNKSSMAKYGLDKVVELLLVDHQTHTILGALGFLRLLLPLIIRDCGTHSKDDVDTDSHTMASKLSTNNDGAAAAANAASLSTAAASFVESTMLNECRQIIEIYDYCLYLMSTSFYSNHAIINAALEVSNAILQAVSESNECIRSKENNNKNNSNVISKTLQQLLHNQQLQHNEYIKKRKSLKNQIFQLKNYEATTAIPTMISMHRHPTAAEQSSVYKAAREDECKLEMQKYENTGRRKIRQGGEGESGTSASATPELVKGINVASDAVSAALPLEMSALNIDNLKRDAALDVADNDKVSLKFTTEKYTRKLAARSISECVEDDKIFAEIILPQPPSPSPSPPPVNIVIVDSLIDTDANETNRPTNDAKVEQLSSISASDDKSQHLSDFDNESFNSIDFESEITIAGVDGAQMEDANTAAATGRGDDDRSSVMNVVAGSKPNTDTIGSFFNNLLSQSNAASESVSRLFRPTSAAKNINVKSSPTDKCDVVSITSQSVGDGMSYVSIDSSGTKSYEANMLDKQNTQRIDGQSQCSSLISTSTIDESVVMRKLLCDNDKAENAEKCMGIVDMEEQEEVVQEEEKVEVELRRKQNANPFLLENSPLKQTVIGTPILTLNIGSIYEQSIIFYTTRLIAARFLLTGQPRELQQDSAIRVSIKSLSLGVLAQCARLVPEALQLPLEITDLELKILESTEITSSKNRHTIEACSSSSSSNLSADYEHLDVGGGGNDSIDFIKDQATLHHTNISDLSEETLLLEIKDDHFGKSTCDDILNEPLSRSADPVLLALQINNTPKKKNIEKLSKSDIVETSRERKGGRIAVTITAEDTPPEVLPPRPPKRTKSLRKPNITLISTPVSPFHIKKQQQQPVSDVLLYYNHTDPILRAGVQQIIGNFLQASGAGLTLELRINLQHLLAILLKGLQDEIHTVVIQALNAFDKTFPHVVSKYLTEPPCHYQWLEQQQQQQLQQDPQQEQQKHLNFSTSSAFKLKQMQTSAMELLPSNRTNDVEHPYQSCLKTAVVTTATATTTTTTTTKNPNTNKNTSTTFVSTTSSASMFDHPAEPFTIDKIIAVLLNAFEHGSSTCSDNNEPYIASTPIVPSMPVPKHPTEDGGDGGGGSRILLLSPKLLLNALRLCRNNKYWLVQNKYAEVISDLNYAAMRSYDNKTYNSNNNIKDFDCIHEGIFLDELLELIGDDDVRVREHAGECLCRFIVKNARKYATSADDAISFKNSTTDNIGDIQACDNSIETYQTNFNLFVDFLDYAIFSNMSSPLRNLFSMQSSKASSAFEIGFDFDGRFCPLTLPAMQRQRALEEKLLSKVLYRLINKLMELNDRSLQFGIIYSLKQLLLHFNFVDYREVWMEFDCIEICIKYMYYHPATALDLTCQSDLLHLTSKLIAGFMLVLPPNEKNYQKQQQQLDQLFTHTMKILNIYYHLVTNQKPLLFIKAQKVDIFPNVRELAAVQSTGYFGGEYVYIKLYNTLKVAFNSYKMTINQESGAILISLLKTCLSTLSFCIEMRTHTSSNATTADGVFPSSATLKLIEEILQYLAKLINYAPGECVSCLRQLLKYLFGQNYGSRQQQYQIAFIRPYFVLRGEALQQQQQQNGLSNSSSCSVVGHAAMAAQATSTLTTVASACAENATALDYRLFGEVFAGALDFYTCKSELESHCAKHIKLFEPLVIYCLTLFMKSNAQVQAPILELLSQLLDLNVTYSVLDSKNVIFDQIINTLDLIESGVARNALVIVSPMIKLLVQLTYKSDRKLITIPKVISIVNNLLASNTARECAVLAAKVLAYEIFLLSPSVDLNKTALNASAEQRGAFQSPTPRSPMSTPVQQQQHLHADKAAQVAEVMLANALELDTQKEVVLGMLEKFIDASECQAVFSLLLLRQRCMAQQAEIVDRMLHQKTTDTIKSGTVQSPCGAEDISAVYSAICRSICEGRFVVNNWQEFLLLEASFRNSEKNVLADSKEFLALLQLLITKDVENFSNLSCATIILTNVILKTEEIYLVNHIKLFLRNHPAIEATASEKQQRKLGESSWLRDNDGPSTSSAAAATARSSPNDIKYLNISETHYFAQVLCEKLLECLATLSAWETPSTQYIWIAVRFVRTLNFMCCGSKLEDAMLSAFRAVLADSDFLEKYYNLIMMHATPMSANVLSRRLAHNAPDVEEMISLLHFEVFKLLTDMELLEPIVLLQQIQAAGVKKNVLRKLLREVCLRNKNAASSLKWLLKQQQPALLDGAFLNNLITKHFSLTCSLCQSSRDFCSLMQIALLERVNELNKHAIRLLLRLILNVGCNTSDQDIVVRFLELLLKLHQSLGLKKNNINAPLQLQVAQVAQRLFIIDLPRESSRQAIEACLAQEADQPLLLVLRDLFTRKIESHPSSVEFELCTVDEKWLFTQLIKFSTEPDNDPQQLAKILLDIQSENKLYKIFNNATFNVPRVLRHTISISLESMLAAFRNNCVQHNPHIHYMQPNPLARVAVTVLMARINAVLIDANAVDVEVDVDDREYDFGDNSTNTTGNNNKDKATSAFALGVSASDLNTVLSLVRALIALIDFIKHIEETALIYIESKFIEKFVREHLLTVSHVATLVNFLAWCCVVAKKLLSTSAQQEHHLNGIATLLQCIDSLLCQKLVWNEINLAEKSPMSSTTERAACNNLSTEQRNSILCQVLDVLVLLSTQATQNTLFYERFKLQRTTKDNEKNLTNATGADGKVGIDLIHEYAPKAAFLAKLIETKIDARTMTDALQTDYITGANSNRRTMWVSANDASQVAYGLLRDVEGVHTIDAQTVLDLIESIGVSVLRTNQFYAYAVTPYEIIQQQKLNKVTAHISDSVAATSGKLPTIPVEHLSDVDVLRVFINRLSIFGFTMRQQFEEYFMTFLLLINKVYDENMVDQQEQLQIKSACLEAISELLITYKTFAIVGNKLSHFHHTTRWPRIICDNISLKKLHRVQLLVSSWNVFYHPNLERQLTTNLLKNTPDNLIGTNCFHLNQFDLNFIWHQMEAYAQSSNSPNDEQNVFEGTITRDGVTIRNTNKRISRVGSMSINEDIVFKNYQFFTTLSGIDFKSSSQLVFDVLMQMIEHNHVLVLGNLVKFCEICESRDQIKWIKDKVLRLQETIPMDDTISHQHLIYLVCKTQAVLIPTFSELQHLCLLIGNYLKSSHIFIRNATLAGVLCLLECCSKTNTTIGRLSEELSLLRDLIVGYINKHGLVEESSLKCSDTHTKLVWTLNFSLIEWTSKFVPQCHLLSNTIIAATSLLKRTQNEEIYLCVLHGFERLIVINNCGCAINTQSFSSSGIGNSDVLSGVGIENGNGIVSPALHKKIEKLALELVKLENEKYAIPALKLLVTCIYVGSTKQLENTELSNGIVQDDPEIIAQQIDKVDILLHCIKSSTRDSAWIYGQVLCQIIRDLVPPNEILTKVIKEFLAINQPHCDVIAMIVYQVFRSAIDSSFLPMLQDWLICSLPTFLALPEHRSVWCLTVIFLSASINLHLIKLFPMMLGVSEFRKLDQNEIALFVTVARDFYGRLSGEQKKRFCMVFDKFQQNEAFISMMQCL